MSDHPSSSPPTPADAIHTPRRSGMGWATGVLLILIGVIFLIQNLTSTQIRNWWAVFILIPAVSSFSRAYKIHQAGGGRFTRLVTRPIFSGLTFVAIAVLFLFNLDWNLLVPILLILLGISGLASALLR